MNRRNFEPTNKILRVAQYHHDANECTKAGFPGFAEVNRDMATLLTPRAPRVTEDDKEERTERTPKRKQWSNLPDPGMVG